MDIRQISVFLENRPGQLVRITSLLSENDVNLLALNVAETQDYGLLRIIVDDTDKAVEVLKSKGLLSTVNPVICIAVPDVPGGLCHILDIIAKDNIDIEYMYSIIANVSGHAYMVMRAKEPGTIKAAFERNNITVANAEDLNIK